MPHVGIASPKFRDLSQNFYLLQKKEKENIGNNTTNAIELCIYI